MTESTHPTPAEQDRAFRPDHVPGVPWSTLSAVLRDAGIDAVETGSAPRGPVTGACLNSRVVQPGDLYVALPGARVHGARFVAAALEAGALAVLTDAEGAALVAEAGLADVAMLQTSTPRAAAGVAAAAVYGAGLDAGPRLIGVTGTNGKTTTSFLACALLEAIDLRTGVIGTILTRAGDRTVPSSLTTPESTQLHALMALMRQEQVDTAVMEVSSHAVAFERIAGLRFAVAGFTNLTQDHLDLHGSMEEYAEAKLGLFDAERTGRAVVVLDGGEGPEWGVAMADRAGAPTTTLALGPAAPVPGALAERHPEVTPDWELTALTPDGLGHRFELTQARTGRVLKASVGLPGRFNTANAALAALMVLEALGDDTFDRIQAVLDVPAGEGPFAAAVPGRMEVVGREPDGVVDFAHNPDGMVQALESLAQARAATGRRGRTILVFGATGERDTTKRPLMGRIAARYADVVIVTDDDPHGEEPASIRAEVLEGVRAEAAARQEQGHRVEVHESAPRAEAIRLAAALAEDADSILLAGRGHETVQDVAGVDVELDDRVELRAALADRRDGRHTDLSSTSR